MLCKLRREIYLASVGDDLIGLDIGKGAYGCLPQIGEAVGSASAAGDIEVADASIAELLADAGWLDSGAADTGARFAPHLPAPSKTAWRTQVETVTPADRARMARAYLVVARRYWGRSFARIVAWAATGTGEIADADERAWVRDARVFDQMMPGVPFQGVCLFRAVMLLAYLRLAGRDAHWVIGVQTYPFMAHCWLQVGDTVLDDAAERVCGFTPILTI